MPAGRQDSTAILVLTESQDRLGQPVLALPAQQELLDRLAHQEQTALTGSTVIEGRQVRMVRLERQGPLDRLVRRSFCWVRGLTASRGHQVYKVRLAAGAW